MNKEYPLVSVVMAEYNTNENVLKESIKSIITQTYENIEFIIINDGSKTNLEKIVDHFKDDRIKIINNKVNKGLPYSLNKGIEEANGKYIARMDSDDISFPNRIKKQVEFLESHPKYTVLGAKAIEFDENGEIGVLGKSGKICNTDLYNGNTPIHPTVLMKRSEVNKIKYNENYRRSQDLALWFEMLVQNERIYVMDEVLLYYRVHSIDYKKRRLKHRKYEIKARWEYYSKLDISFMHCMYTILKSIIAGLLPGKLIGYIRKKIVLKK